MTVESKYRPRCYIDIEIDHEPIGRIVLELFSDICPKTCENFLSLCTGDKGLGKTTNKYLCYKGTVFHRIIKNFMIQSGDFESGNGTGGESIFGGQFNDENFIIKHDKPFLLSMANKGRNTNGSQFFITTQSTPHLDGKHTVFGHVISGHHFVTEIENSKTDQNSRPIKEVKIAECGELVPKEKKRKKNSSSELSSSSEEEKKKKKKKKKHSKKYKHEKKSTRNVSENKDEGENEDAAFSVDPGDIPEIPANNFLFRKTSPSAEFRSNSRKRRDFSYRRRVPSRSRSGRKIKGRGNRRYRTPVSSDEQSGSETPPHWKMASSKLKSLKDVIQTKNDDESEEDQTPDEDFEDDNTKNPVLQSRLGASSRKDARMNIDENRRRDQEHSPEHDFKRNNRKSDIFKKLIDEEKQGVSKQGWFEDTTSKQKDRKSSPIRSKIVVKSSITSRNKDDEILFSEEDNQRYGKRRSRLDVFTNRRPFDSHMEFSSAQDTRHRRESDVWHYTDTNKKESVDKHKSSSRDLKHLNALKNDLLKYTKKNNKDTKKTENASTVSKSENPFQKMEIPSASKKNMKKLEEDVLKCIKSNTKESSSEPDDISVTQLSMAENMSVKNSVNDDSNLGALQVHDTQKIPFLEETSTIEPRSPIENSEDLKLTQNKGITIEKNESNCPTSPIIGDSNRYDYQDFIQLKNVPIPMVQDELGIDHFIPESQCSTATSDDGDIHKKSPAYSAPLPDIIPLPEEVISIKDASIAALEDRRREIIASLGESENKFEKTDSDFEVNEESSVATYKHNRNESSKDSRMDCSPESSKLSEIHSSKRCNNSIEPLEIAISKKPERNSKSPSDNKPSVSTRSRSPIDHHSKSPVRRNKSPGPRKHRSTTNRNSKSHSRSRSRRRSISRNRSYRRYSRSPDFRQRSSRSHPRNSARGVRSYHYSGVRNRSPERRGSYQRRYGRISPHRGRTRGSASRRSITRSRSRSVNKRRRRRHPSSSSSSSSTSSSSHSEKNRKRKNIAKGKKRRSSSSSSSSTRSKRSNSHST